MAGTRLSDDKIRRRGFEDSKNHSSDDELKKDNYIPSNDDGENNEIIPDLVLFDEDSNCLLQKILLWVKVIPPVSHQETSVKLRQLFQR